MMTKKKTTYLIETPRQLKEIFRPVRNEIRMALEMLGPSTVPELAEHLGRSAESLYYHVRKLQSVSLIVENETRIRNGHEEVVYRLCADRIRVNTEIRTKSFVEALVRGTRALLRFAERSMTHAYTHTSTVLQGRTRECRLVQLTTRLSSKQVIELNRRILELEEYLESAASDSREKQFVVTIALSPRNSGLDDE